MKNLVEKLPDQQPALRVMAMPPDTNQYGDVFGGWIMSQVDLAGSSIASRVANSRTATVAVTSFTFKEPVWVGDVVSFYATVLKVRTTSITVGRHCFCGKAAQRQPSYCQSDGGSAGFCGLK